ncbi:signal peptidase II [Aureimonas fodinaquatilis]|uniref:Lipoprotein signal peptidase n=1 Tax=Aureimonas fodinaquatilis TaxID=2565783 RepID=A0A5B0DRC8_9HYPH|nr:signal peptidase II [Aureimonas fodinaquatilis]KAA0968552.1 signal peptidase II [Aureimonas fodinaquatilis]
MKFILGNVFIVVTAIFLDQFIKLVVATSMPLGSSITLLPFFSLLHARNTGIAFSMFSDLGGLPLAAVSILVLLFALWLWSSTPRERGLTHFAFALIFGGAIGNLVDRLTLGYVTDYFYFHTPVWSFAVFNLADVFITVGAALIFLDEFVFQPRRAKAEKALIAGKADHE